MHLDVTPKKRENSNEMLWNAAFPQDLHLLLRHKISPETEIRVGVIKIVIVINCNLITFSKVIACNCN